MATRNIKLDDLLKAEPLGASPIPDLIAKTGVQFGIIPIDTDSNDGSETVLGSTVSTHTDYSGDTVFEEPQKTAHENADVMAPAISHACFGLESQVTPLKRARW